MAMGLSAAVAGAETEGYRIGPQNLLQIEIVGEKSIQQIYRVDEQGYITHPLVGRVRIGGHTVADAEQLMIDILEDGYIHNPKVTIFVQEHSYFSILGEVRNPGQYEMLGDLTLLEAISMSGGFTQVADEKHVRILRRTEQGQETLQVNMNSLIKGDNSSNVYVNARDVISVPKSMF